MKTKSILLTTLALALIITTVGIISGAKAITDNQTSEAADRSDNSIYSQHRQKIEQAIENRDYAAWKNLMENPPQLTDIITTENFADFAAMKAAMKSGDQETAQSLREKLGLTGAMHMGTGMMGPGGDKHCQ